jgi:hypothetical protein
VALAGRGRSDPPEDFPRSVPRPEPRSGWVVAPGRSRRGSMRPGWLPRHLLGRAGRADPLLSAAPGRAAGGAGRRRWRDAGGPSALPLRPRGEGPFIHLASAKVPKIG